MAKVALIQRELKRKNLVLKYQVKYKLFKAVLNNASSSLEQRFEARLALQRLPRNANPTRQRRRCAITGRPRGTYRYFGLGRSKLRELAFAGAVPGIMKASW